MAECTCTCVYVLHAYLHVFASDGAALTDVILQQPVTCADVMSRDHELIVRQRLTAITQHIIEKHRCFVIFSQTY